MESASISVWVDQLKRGHPQAAQELWERYYSRLTAMARGKLGPNRRVVDEEDLALTAFDSFCRGAAEGRFPRLEDRDDLWQLLLMITSRKAANLRKHFLRLKRGAGRVAGESVFAQPGATSADPGLDGFAGSDPSPEFAVQVTEEFQRLLDALPDPPLRLIAILKLEGHTNEEISRSLDCSLSSVERKLRLIREHWAFDGIDQNEVQA